MAWLVAAMFTMLTAIAVRCRAPMTTMIVFGLGALVYGAIGTLKLMDLNSGDDT